MNPNAFGSFEELNPRSAPTPFSFSDVPVISTVPEVSLIFGDSPLKRTSFDKHVSHQKPADYHQSTSYKETTRDSRISDVQGLPELRDKYTSVGGMKNRLHEDHMVSRTPERHATTNKMHTDSFTNKYDEHAMRIIHRRDESGPRENLYSPRAYSVQNSSPNRFSPHSHSPLAGTNGISSIVPPENTSLSPRVHNSDSRVYHSPVSARQCSDNDTHCRQMSHQTAQYYYSGPTPNPSRLPVQPSCREGCCLNATAKTQTQREKEKPVSVDAESCLNCSGPHNINYSNINGCRQCASCISSTDNRNTHINCSKTIDVPEKQFENNKFGDNNCHMCKRSNLADKVIVSPACNLQKESKNHCKKNCRCPEINNDLETCFEKVQKNEKHEKDTCSTPSTNQSEEKPDKGNSDTAILKEIAMMNQRQCSILQGLLEQVVAMQSDQMKILREINVKLTKPLVSEDTTLGRKKEDCISKEVLKREDVTTQTVAETNICSKCEACDRNATSSNRSNSPKNTFVGDGCETVKDRCETKDREGSPKKLEVEKDINKAKKMQDRAVSWSAVNGLETVEESFTLHGVCVPTVIDNRPSSVHTMHLHVQDYHSSASFDSITENRHVNENDFAEGGCDNLKGSWTLYDNIVGHVKKFLQTVPCEKSGNASQKTSQVEAIRFATIEKIRQLGVSVIENSTEITETGRIQFDAQIASVPSFHDPSPEKNDMIDLQNLALKYLQDDEICDLMKNHNTPIVAKNCQKPANVSIATQRYLEKYRLLQPCADYKDKRQMNAHCGPVGREENILDITTLKKQPKLL